MSKFIIKTIVIVIIGFIVLIGLSYCVSVMRNKRPAENPSLERFDLANRSIGAFNGNEVFGNVATANGIAASFSARLKQIREESFTKGNSSGISFSQGHFMTYCYQDSDAVIIMCHVPEFRKFKDEAKESLMLLAWGVAQDVTKEKMGQNFTGKVILGLRGAAVYYRFWVGKDKGGLPTSYEDRIGRSAVSKFFK